jgi:hypothetical protein
MGEKTDCCPFHVSNTTSTTVTGTGTTTTSLTTTTIRTQTETVTVSQAAGPSPGAATQLVFPNAANAGEATLLHCPDDYETISSVCCPS